MRTLATPEDGQGTWARSDSRVAWRGAPAVDTDAEYEWLFREEFPAVMRTVFLICQDVHRAQDITQDAFVQLLKHWRKVSRYERPGAWVRRVAIRLTMEFVRRERLRSQLEREIDPPTLRGPADVDVMKAISSLPRMQRGAVVLFYLEDMPLSEVADILGCSGATARVHLHRARSRLAEVLGEEVLGDVDR
jgi:RNA polymerase sigma factor (sigma-70 family)